MKKILSVALVIFFAITTGAQTSSQKAGISINKNFSKAAALETILKRYTKDGLPGASLAVYSEQEGWWAGVAGYSNVETKKEMNIHHLQYLQSVAKTYMATAILKLYEDGKLKLDDPATKYLPAKFSKYLAALNKVTVRMLLNHSSGLPEYSTHPAFVSFVMLHPTLVFNAEEGLKYLSGEPMLFEPGTKHSYTNTNYLLLSVIADKLTGDHAAYIDKNIFHKLGLTNTFYRSNPGYLKYTNLVDSYWDVLNTGRPANITSLQKANVATLKGDDGIVCTTTDAIQFLKGLEEGRLLKDSTLALMKQWVNDDEGKPIYGLGLVHYEAGGLTGYGHSGGGIGAGCILLYVPEKKIYIFMATNVGTLFGGSLAKKADDLKNEVLATLLF
ncbi:MAG: serine hydrolase domain-containing protein [Ferruginibacter sp.]